jgi:hypothetical protein
MKVKVIKKFRDKHTKKIHNIGDVLTISQERYVEICSVGKFVERINEEPKAAEPKKATKKATKKSN